MLALILAGLRLQKSSIRTTGEARLVVTSIGSKSEENYKIDKTTALNLLREKHNATLKHAFIECIDNVCADSGYWWLLLVNGKESSESAFSYYVKGGDIIEFRFSKK